MERGKEEGREGERPPDTSLLAAEPTLKQAAEPAVGARAMT